MPSLWSPTGWPQRLAELQAPTGELKEAPLRRDVRSLGALLGEVLREQAGLPLYQAVEDLRRTAIARREAGANSTDAHAALAEQHLQHALARVQSLSNATAYQLARAFAFFFELTNLAETNHRKRRRLSHQLDPNAGPQRGSFRGTLRALKLAGVTAEEARALLDRITVTPVFTAHPTEVARRSVMSKRRRISTLLEQLDRIPVPEAQLESIEQEVIAEITALWQTDNVRMARPAVRDEVRMALDYFESSIFATLPVLYSEVAAALASEYGIESDLAELPRLVAFGSWIGGDRDGNPFVTPRATRSALAMAHGLLMAHYRRRLQNVSDQLAGSTQQVPISPELAALLEGYMKQLRAAGQTELEARFPFESVRLLVGCIMMRLGGSPQISVPPPSGPPLKPYARAEEFVADLTVLHSSLIRNRGRRLAQSLIDPLLLEVRTYGLHLQTLDIRQHARVHAAAIAELAQKPGVLSESTDPLQLPPALTPQTREVLNTFRAIAELKRVYVPEALPRYIISGATGAEDVLNVLWLARLAGVRVEGCGGPDGCPDELRPRPPPHQRSWRGPRPAARPALRIHRRPAQCTRRLPPALDLRRLQAAARVLELSAGGHARLLRLQQGRRHGRQHLGDLEGASRAAPGGRRVRSHPPPLPRPRRHRRPRRWPHPPLHLRPAHGRLHRRVCASPSRAKSSTGSTPTSSSPSEISN